MALPYISLYIVPVLNTWQVQFTLTFTHYLHISSVSAQEARCALALDMQGLTQREVCRLMYLLVK